jgi:asparagine synthase (glutamine-hydrolysing)
MPGISLVCDLDESLTVVNDSLVQALEKSIHSNEYHVEILWSTPSCFLACTRYEQYPVLAFENDRFRIVVEGEIYGKSQTSLQAELLSLAESAFDREIEKERVTRWLRITDGEFVLVVLDKHSNRVALVNDLLGRLPLYYFSSGRRLVVSREMGFLTELSQKNEVDKVAISQLLLLKCPLGDRTLVVGKNRLTYASLIMAEPRRKKISVERLHEFNFDGTEHGSRSVEENAENLVELFLAGCRNRIIADSKNVLSLSGGLDSRAVGAALCRQEIPFCCVTFAGEHLDFNRDVEIAARLANVFNTEWRLFHLRPPTGKDLLKLLRVKYGLNYLDMSFILPFLEELTSVSGKGLSYITGLGGNTVLYPLAGSRAPKTVDDLVDYVIKANQYFPFDDVVALTGLSKQHIFEEIRHHVDSFPEENMARRHVHFRVFGKGSNWTFEGADRNRVYFRTVSPFYSLPFFKYAMECPDEQKAGSSLYRAFLRRLSEEASSLDDANWGLPITSRRYPLNLFCRGLLTRLPYGMKRSVKGILQKKPDLTLHTKCIFEQLGRCPSIQACISRMAVTKVLKSCSKSQAERLLTVTSYMEMLETGRSSLENYSDVEFR